MDPTEENQIEAALYWLKEFGAHTCSAERVGDGFRVRYFRHSPLPDYLAFIDFDNTLASIKADVDYALR